MHAADVLTHTHTHTHTQTHTHKHTHTTTHTHTRTHRRANKKLQTFTHMHIYTHVGAAGPSLVIDKHTRKHTHAKTHTHIGLAGPSVAPDVLPVGIPRTLERRGITHTTEGECLETISLTPPTPPPPPPFTPPHTRNKGRYPRIRFLPHTQLRVSAWTKFQPPPPSHTHTHTHTRTHTAKGEYSCTTYKLRSQLKPYIESPHKTSHRFIAYRQSPKLRQNLENFC